MNSKKPQRKRNETDQEGTDFGIVDFHEVGSTEFENNVQTQTILLDVLDLQKPVQRFDKFNQQTVTNSRKNQNGETFIVVRPGDRVCVSVANIDITYKVEALPNFTYECGLHFLGYDNGKVYLLNISDGVVELKEGQAIAKAVLQ